MQSSVPTLVSFVSLCYGINVLGGEGKQAYMFSRTEGKQARVYSLGRKN